MTDTVCTLFELRAGDDTVNEGVVTFYLFMAVFFTNVGLGV